MKTLLLTTSVVLFGVGNAFANAVHADTQTQPYEQVDSFRFFGDLNSWRAIDKDTLILWATPNQPYLVELMRDAQDLRSTEVIGVTSTVGRITDLDTVLVHGRKYPIKAIYKLDRHQAAEIRRQEALRQNA